MKKIIVTLNRKTGEITVKPEGFSGPACLAATRTLEAALGKVVTDEKTMDFYATEQAPSQDQTN